MEAKLKNNAVHQAQGNMHAFLSERAKPLKSR
jgi:hypothetical protein